MTNEAAKPADQRLTPAYMRWPFALIVSLFAVGGAHARDQAAVPDMWGPQEPPFAPSHPIAIVGGTLIDATGADPKLGYTVVIEDETISEVGPSEGVAIPDGAQVIDAEGMTIMPGIINSNQHLQLNPLYPAPAADLPLDELKARWEDTFARMPRRAFIYLMQGVTSMRQTSGPWQRLVPLKERIDAGELAGPRIFLGGALLMSEEHFAAYLEKHDTPPEAREWLRDGFAYSIIEDVDEGTDRFLGPEYDYWKLLMSFEPFNGQNDFTDEEIRSIIDKAHANGMMVDVHAPEHGSNSGLRRMLPFDFDTLEHPFSGSELIDQEIIEAFVDKDVIVATLLTVKVAGAERAADPHRFNQTLYIASMRPDEYRILLRYRDKMLFNKRHPDRAGLPIYESRVFSRERPSEKGDTFGLTGPSYNELQARRRTSRTNMRRFIREGTKFSLGTDTPAFLNFQQEDPNADEFRYMVELGMTPMEAIIAATRNGAEALGMLDELGTIEEGKLADVIVVAGNPLLDVEAMKNVYAVIKGGVRYK